ncbi:hypothetical protein CTM74_00435 [Fusobacterium pseudoperiodonticum]|uniref:PIN family toxin-antitoxin system n=1 Tax=Fusobacterium pseudoperiodonticum TaxID=2663009 RepID=A0AAD0AJN5_9FUSO|nr:hypothetical protein CTM64_11895 [Fusobacterium pseudoperiodonticum]ATV60481.1 hypothetical protein CTM74_00435 [Fusobacterium pseudoperiodonticum]
MLSVSKKFRQNLPTSWLQTRRQLLGSFYLIFYLKFRMQFHLFLYLIKKIWRNLWIIHCIYTI